MRLQFACALLLIMLVGCAPATATPTAQRATATQVAENPSATPSEVATLTSIPADTLTPAPTPTWQTCIFTAGSEGAEVYAAPLPTYSNPPDPQAVIPSGESAPVAFRGSILDGVLWVGIVWDGSVGYVMADASTLQGDCPSLLDDQTFAGTGPIVVKPEEIDYRIHMAGDVGTVWLFTQTLPAEDGDLVHTLEITAELQAGSVRWADYEITCEGEDTSEVQWGFWDQEIGGITPISCADALRETLNSANKHYVEVSIPAGSAPITYTIRIKLTQFHSP
jgi:hypothetical protein